MRPRTATFVLVPVALLLTGCYSMYWTKPGGDLEQFTADHQACVRDSATPVPRKPGYGIVNQKLYRACLQASGWKRQEVINFDANAGGWFRGIEDEDVVRLDELPEQPRGARTPMQQEPKGVETEKERAVAAKEATCRRNSANSAQFKACMEQ